MRAVTMTKCLYAMLFQQKYNPEKRTGWNLVNTSDSQHKAQITGIKIVNKLIFFFLEYCISLTILKFKKIFMFVKFIF